MVHTFKKLLASGLICVVTAAMSPLTSLASVGPGFTSGSYVATITAESVNINKRSDSNEVLMTAKAGSSYEVLEDLGNGWVKVCVGDKTGYLPVSGNATVEEAEAGEIERIHQLALASSNSYKRQKLVDYALQFVGGPYKYGGSNPLTGTDCSGFTKYVLENGGGVAMNRSSRGQAVQGVAISADQMQPGDLLFYGGSAGSINHVAMYIGGGQVVHASTERTGITVSDWNYRTPVKITNVMG